MPAKRTVDETGESTAGAFVGLRLSGTQEIKLDQLCALHGLNRSAMMRKLIIDTWADTPDVYGQVHGSDPF